MASELDPRPARLVGLAVAAAVACVAIALGRAVPLVGAPVLALALGAAISAVRSESLPGPGLALAIRYGLAGGLVVLGTTLSLDQLASIGSRTFPVMLGTLAVAFLVAAVIGRLLGVPPRLRILVGVGTGICGASAIAAVSGVVRAKEAEIAYAMSTIFAFNIVAVVLFPPLGHMIGLDSAAFGVWAGTAINDTSSVVATAYSYGQSAGSDAVVVKLTRTTMIIPIVALLAMSFAHAQPSPAGWRWLKSFPWFLVGFVVAAAAASAGLVPGSAEPALEQLALILITLALAAVGLATRLGDLRRAGGRPLLLGGLVWASVATSSLLLQRLTGIW